AGTLSACLCCMGALSFIESCSTSKNVTSSKPSFNETTDAVTFSVATFADKNFVLVPVKKYDQPIYVAKQSDGSYLALRMYCTHRGCSINAAPDKFVCPCHGSEFSFHGDVLKGPATQPLISLPVTADQNNVTVHFS